MSEIPSGTYLMALDDIPDPGGRPAQIEDLPVLMIRSGQTLRAYINVCPHAGRPLCLASGRTLVKEDILVCPFHGASFDIASGQSQGGPAGQSSLKPVEIAVRDGEIYTR